MDVFSRCWHPKICLSLAAPVPYRLHEVQGDWLDKVNLHHPKPSRIKINSHVPDAFFPCPLVKSMSSSNSPRTSQASPIVPPFKWSHLWKPAIVNPVNFKSYTIPIFNLRSLYGRAFHLSWRTCLVSILHLQQLYPFPYPSRILRCIFVMVCVSATHPRCD